MRFFLTFYKKRLVIMMNITNIIYFLHFRIIIIYAWTQTIKGIESIQLLLNLALRIAISTKSLIQKTKKKDFF